MKVTLISYTQDALDVLLFSRSTRLQVSPEAMAEIKAWPDAKKVQELAKARQTIKSSWEFVDYIFAIQNVTRAFTHQLVRHRAGTGFAQQAMRVVDMAQGPGWTYETGPGVLQNPQAQETYQNGMLEIAKAYHKMVHVQGVPTEDARGILPTNVHTNILFKANLHTLHDMGTKRLCVKTQGEFQEVFKKIRDRVIEVHPWAADFIRVHCAFYGNCVFPDFPVEKCAIKPGVYNGETGLAYDGGDPLPTDGIQGLWRKHNGKNS